jgi:hypothetical protein
MTRVLRPKKSKAKWYVSFERKDRRPGRNYPVREAETFRNEQEAKAFARTKLADSQNINAGTINPHLPKRMISSKQVLDWLDEPEVDDQAEGTDTND